jgi:threonine dehydrogenase-like Zn-dependent dehydrogenase
VEGADVSRTARAYWLAQPESGEIRTTVLPDPGAGEVLVRTLVSGISRGTEALVFRGGVPESQYDVMRAPFQEGDFPGPVKYGYLNVGAVDAGPDDLVGRTVFCLYPHQTAYVVPVEAVTVVPDAVPARRAVLAGTVETAVNALWDARPLLGDRVAVVGAGMVGLCAARLLAGVPGVTVTVVDTDASRADVAATLGTRFASPAQAPRDLDLVVHASGTAAGLQLSLDLLGADGTVTDLSWYGDTPVGLRLGGRFHSARLGVKASQVGEVAEARRGRRTTAERRALALELLRDRAFDALLTGESTFDELPEVMGKLASGSLPALCHTIGYDDEPDRDRVRES